MYTVNGLHYALNVFLLSLMIACTQKKSPQKSNDGKVLKITCFHGYNREMNKRVCFLKKNIIYLLTKKIKV